MSSSGSSYHQPTTVPSGASVKPWPLPGAAVASRTRGRPSGPNAWTEKPLPSAPVSGPDVDGAVRPDVHVPRPALVPTGQPGRDEPVTAKDLTTIRPSSVVHAT